MIKLVIFDLDGVLCDTKDIHYHALNKALSKVDERFVIPYLEHLERYDGLPTKEKLKMLTKSHHLDQDLHQQISEDKQRYTFELLDFLQPNENAISTIYTLKSKGYLVYVASNSIFVSVKKMLDKIGVLHLVDYFISNEECKNPKPSGEIYLRCIIRANLSPSETVIFEDSDVGKCSARNSGAHLIEVGEISEINVKTVLNKIDEIDKNDKRCDSDGRIRF